MVEIAFLFFILSQVEQYALLGRGEALEMVKKGLPILDNPVPDTQGMSTQSLSMSELSRSCKEIM